MRKGTADGVGTLLPSPTQVNQKKAGKSLRASNQLPASITPGEKARPTRRFEPEADAVFLDRAWPRHYRLPGLAGITDHTAEEMMEIISLVFHRHVDHLHDLVASLAQTDPRDAAELAEALAIVEQTVCAGGLGTELETTPLNGLSPLLRLDALARVQVLNKRSK